MSSTGAWSTCLTEKRGTTMLGLCAGRWHSTTRTISSLFRYTRQISLVLTTISEGNSERPRDSVYHHNCQSSAFFVNSVAKALDDHSRNRGLHNVGRDFQPIHHLTRLEPWLPG